jgi:hypothetical protein
MFVNLKFTAELQPSAPSYARNQINGKGKSGQKAKVLI